MLACFFALQSNDGHASYIHQYNNSDQGRHESISNILKIILA